MDFDERATLKLARSYDRPLTEAVKFVEQIPVLYDFAANEVARIERILQDIDHVVELTALDDVALLVCAKKVAELRRQRRVAKDAVVRLKPIRDYMSKYKDAVNALPQLLGEIRGVERTQTARVYLPKELKEADIERLVRGGAVVDPTEGSVVLDVNDTSDDAHVGTDDGFIESGDLTSADFCHAHGVAGAVLTDINVVAASDGVVTTVTPKEAAAEPKGAPVKQPKKKEKSVKLK